MSDYKSFDDYFNYSLDKQFGAPNIQPPESIDVGGAVGRVEIRPSEETKGDFGTIINSGYATAKGALQGELGILGELEHLWNGITAIYNTPDGKSKVDEFLTGLSKESQFPDTERMKEILNKVVPEVNKDYTMAETIGEIVAPGALLTGMAAKGAKAIKKASSSVIIAPTVEVKAKANK
jgi:hypothetical protein